MSKLASKVVAQAQAWLGKKASDGTHKEIVDIYNAHKPLARGYKVKYTDYWCATFVSAVAIKLGYTDIIPTECGCGQMITLLQQKGCWVENDAHTPKAGDIIFYDWDDNGNGDCTGWPEHVGYVEKVSGNTITVIEGNYNNAVKRRTLTVNGKNIRGYGVPKYDAEPVVNTKPQTTAKSLDEWAKEVIDLKHGKGHATREASLKKAGCTYAYATVRARVNELLKGNSSSSAATPATKPAATPTSNKVDSARSFSNSVAKKYTTTSALNLRTGAGTGKSKITVIPKGATVQCYGYYTTVSGVKWLLVKYGSYTGFCCKTYLK